MCSGGLMTENMALADPLPPSNPHLTSNMSWSTFSRYDPTRRAGSPEDQHGLRTLESIAAEFTLLSTSPTAGFNYLAGEYYSSSTTTTIFHSVSQADVGTPKRAPLRKSRSFPKVKRDESLQSCVNAEPKHRFRRSKSVRFADSQGLPLIEAVHQLSVADSSYTENKIVPYDDDEVFGSIVTLKVASKEQLKPSSPKTTATEGARASELLTHSTNLTPPSRSKPASLSPTHKRTFKFTQPGVEPGFYERVSAEKVVLESIREEQRSVHGVIRVANLSYEKEVTVRWTHDAWRAYHETHAVFCANDGSTDRFTFELPVNGDDVQFAIQFKADNREFWDNNRGVNYLISNEYRPHRIMH